MASTRNQGRASDGRYAEAGGGAKKKKKKGSGTVASKGSCAGKGRKNLKGEGQGRPGVKCPSQGYNKSGRGLTAK